MFLGIPELGFAAYVVSALVLAIYALDRLVRLVANVLAFCYYRLTRRGRFG